MKASRIGQQKAESPIGQRFDSVVKRIGVACANVGRSPDSVQLVAVSKRFPVADILEAQACGATLFGESRPQELDRKLKELAQIASSEAQPVFHMIGHLQRNKVKLVVGNCELIHSVDSIRLARAISTRAVELSLVQSVLLQVNISDEEQKHGFVRDELIANMHEITTLPGIVVVGLMGMASVDEDALSIRSQFAGLRELRDQIEVESGQELPELSMGMSNDFETAVEEGSTIVRVGSLIFGPRDR